MTTFFRHFIAVFTLLLTFIQSAQAQECDRIYNPQTGQTVKVQCYNQMGHPIMNGPVMIGGQQIILSNGQMSGCSSRLSIRLGGRDGALGFDTCLAQVAQNSAIRAVPTETITREVVTQRVTTEERQVRSSEQYRTELYCPESDMYLNGRDCELSIGGTVIRRISAVTRRVALPSADTAAAEPLNCSWKVNGQIVKATHFRNESGSWVRFTSDLCKSTPYPGDGNTRYVR